MSRKINCKSRKRTSSKDDGILSKSVKLPSGNGAAPCSSSSRLHSNCDELSKFREWQARYKLVEDDILSARDRRAESKRMRKGKAFGDLCEITEGRAVFCRRTRLSMREAKHTLSRDRLIHPSLFPFFMIGEMTWSVANMFRKELTRRIDRAKHEMTRPFYYEREKARRHALAEERRKIRMRHTLNPCPTKEQILDAWVKAKDSAEALLAFGSLIEDLECYVDNSLRRTDDGMIVGRRPGVKGWLRLNIPALYLKYTTIMAYKAAAKKMRQVIDLHDPIPLSSVLSPHAKATSKTYGAGKKARHGGKASQDNHNEMTHEKRPATDCARRSKMCETDELDALRAKAVYLEVMKPVGDGTRRQTALLLRLKALTDPEAVEESNMLKGWKDKYERKIKVRTKSIWERRLRWTG